MTTKNHSCNTSNAKLTKRQMGSQVTLLKKEMHSAIGLYIKKVGWKRTSSWIFRQEGIWYLTAFVFPVVHVSETGTASFSVHSWFGIKPMMVDPIYWDIAGFPANKAKPLSFRSNAAVQAPPYPIQERSYIHLGEVSLDFAARKIVDNVLSQADVARKTVDVPSFADQVARHPENQSFMMLYCTSLIAEDRKKLAKDTLKDHYGKESRHYGEFCIRIDAM